MEKSENLIPTNPEKNKYYDIALSFAGEDRIYAEKLANALVARNVKVFYDKYEKALLFGKDLYSYLSNLYQHEALYCVMLISKYYANKQWTKHERQAAQARAFTENQEYILPIRLDDTEIPGLPPTIGYLDWFGENGAESIADIIVAKLKPDNYAVIYLANNIRRHFRQTLGQNESSRSPYYKYEALALSIRDRLMEHWGNTYDTYKDNDCKKVHYLSMEFLLGRSLSNAIWNLGLQIHVREALQKLNWDIEYCTESEADAGLGYGNLGRLAACFLDSCATRQLPVIGYGLRYEYGMYTQEVINGWAVENTDHWLRNGNIWEIERPQYLTRIRFGGYTEILFDEFGRKRTRWINTNDVLALPYDVPIPGYNNGTVNTLRLWKAIATEEFNWHEFNAGDYSEAVATKNVADTITMVLYPNDTNENGKALRVQQQYLLASASLQDVIANWIGRHGRDFEWFAEKNCFQLNDTFPSIAIAELMRLLLDIHSLEWNDAWNITCKTMAYTCHTVSPETSTNLPVNLMQALLPRLMEIIFEINARFLAEVSARWPGDGKRVARMSLIEEGQEKQLRLANLAVVGSFSVNGVDESCTNSLKHGLFKDFYEFFPEKFNNKTNGVTPRRWLLSCNEPLANLISETIGISWITDLWQLKKLVSYAKDESFRRCWNEAKMISKQKLIDFIGNELDLNLNINALFDIQVTCIHEYKRQLLNVLHVIHLYDRIKSGDTANWISRCVVIGGKTIPGDSMGKKIIKLITNVASVINYDPHVGDKLKLVFLPNYRVSAMEKVCAGADLSEQIATIGKEFGSTSNMKLMMNGALTIGTFNGTNIEILEEVSDDNFFLFGLTQKQILAMADHYNPDLIIQQDKDLRHVIALLECGHFNQFEPGIFDDILAMIRNHDDNSMTIADFRSYIEAQKRVELAFQDKEKWAQMSILNCAASGKFSIDRATQEYNEEIWKLEAVNVPNVAGW